MLGMASCRVKMTSWSLPDYITRHRRCKPLGSASFTDRLLVFLPPNWSSRPKKDKFFISNNRKVWMRFICGRGMCSISVMQNSRTRNKPDRRAISLQNPKPIWAAAKGILPVLTSSKQRKLTNDPWAVTNSQQARSWSNLVTELNPIYNVSSSETHSSSVGVEQTTGVNKWSLCCHKLATRRIEGYRCLVLTFREVASPSSSRWVCNLVVDTFAQERLLQKEDCVWFITLTKLFENQSMILLMNGYTPARTFWESWLSV